MIPEQPQPVGIPSATTIQIGGQPAVSTHTERPSYTTQTTKLNPLVEQAAQDEIAAQKAGLIAQDQLAAQKTIDLDTEAMKAEAKAEEERRHLAAVQAAQERHAKLVQEAVDAKENKRREMESAGKITSYWEDRSAPARIFSAFLTSLGDANSQQAGGPAQGGASRALAKDQADDMAAKLGRFERSKEYLALAKQDVEAAKMARADEIDRINHEHIIQANQIAAQADAYAKRSGIPKAKIEAEALRAKTEEDNAKRRQQIYEHTNVQVTNQSAKESRTVNEGGPGSGAKPTAVISQQAAENMERARKLILDHPEAWKEYQDALTAENESKGADASLIGREIKGATRFAGASPSSFDKRLKSKEAREIASALAPVITAKARQLDPVGALNEGSMAKGEQALSLTTRTPEEIADEISVFRDQALQQSAAERGRATTTPEGGAAPKAETKPTHAKREGAPETKTLNGKTFVKIRGVWHTKD